MVPKAETFVKRVLTWLQTFSEFRAKWLQKLEHWSNACLHDSKLSATFEQVAPKAETFVKWMLTWLQGFSDVRAKWFQKRKHSSNGCLHGPKPGAVVHFQSQARIPRTTSVGRKALT